MITTPDTLMRKQRSNAVPLFWQYPRFGISARRPGRGPAGHVAGAWRRPRRRIASPEAAPSPPYRGVRSHIGGNQTHTRQPAMEWLVDLARKPFAQATGSGVGR